MPSLLRRALLLLLALAWTEAPCAGGPFDLARPALRGYGMEEGLPSGIVYAFAREPHGRLWAGTVDGPAFFSGQRWVPVRLPQACPSQYIRAILASQDGSVWFGTQDGGLWRLQDQQWTLLHPGDPAATTHVFSLAETKDAQGRLVRWVGTQDRGISALVDGRWRTWGPAEGLPKGTVWRVREVQEPGGDRRVWAATEHGLCVLEGDRWRVLGPADGFPGGDANDVLDVPEPGGGRSVWVSIFDRGLARWDGRAWTLQASGRGFPGRYPTSSLAATVGADGVPTLWVGTLNEGLHWLRDGVWRTLGRNQGFPSVGILGLIPVPEGKPTLLVGTRGAGVTSLDLGGWRTLDETLGVAGQEVTCFAEDRWRGGGFWVGTTGGLARFRPGRPAERMAPGALPSDYIVALLPTAETLWAATLDGLARFDGTAWRREDCGGLVPRGLVICLQATGETLWVGTPRGLLRREGGRWRLMGPKEGLPREFVSSLHLVPDPSGPPQLWAGTRGGGVCRIDAAAWTAHPVPEGFPNGNVYALRATTGRDGRRWLWAGTLGGGLARLDLGTPTRWEVFTRDSRPALSSNYIQRIEEDRQGRLYLSTSTGVDRILLEDRGTGPVPARVDTFTLGDGLPSRNANLGASLVDGQGRVWIGTSRGATVLDPALETSTPPPPPPVLDRALVSGGRTLSPDAPLGHRDRNLRFEFSLPVFHRQEDTRYRVHLEGLHGEDQGWQPEGFREFTTLPSGSYRLKVWARTFDGRISGPLQFPFRVPPPPWLHPLAWVGYALLAVGGVLLLLRLRTRSLQARTVALEASVRERTRIIADQTQALETSNAELQTRNEDLKHTNARNLSLINELTGALAEVKTLRGFIPICAYCKKIRDDHGYWEQIEHYLAQHSDAQFSHGICPDCREHAFGSRPRPGTATVDKP